MGKILDQTHKQEEPRDYIPDENTISEINKDNRNRELPEIPTYPDRLLKQRQGQRRILFSYCLWATGIVMILMFTILFLQIFYRLSTGLNLLDPTIYNIVFVSVIIQFIGVIYIIANKLWDENGMIPIYSLSKEYKVNSSNSI